MKFRALESWRGLCALGVVLYHCNLASHLRDFAPVRNADLGVDFFFVLSGFVLAYAYSGRLAQAGAGYDFMIRRAGRLLPLHLFALGVLLLLELFKWISVYRFDAVAGDAPFTGQTSVTALFVSVFLLNGLGFLPYFAWNGPSWSISTEFWTYLLFLIACLAGPRSYRFIFTVVFLACGLVLALLDARHVQLHTYEGAGMLRCLYGFSSGVLVYLLYRRIKASDTAPAAWLEFLALTAMAALFSGLCSWSRSVAPLIFSGAILVFAFERGMISRLLMTRLPLHLGLVSYSIYLMHQPLLSIVKRAARGAQSKLHVQLFVPGGDGESVLSLGSVWANDALVLSLLAVVIAVATLTYRHIEDPARRYFNELGTRVRRGAHAVDAQPKAQALP